MCSNPVMICEEENAKNSNSNITYRPLGDDSRYVVRYISSSFVRIQQLKTDFNAQHQHEKGALIELNDKLRLMVDCAQQLESQNSKYITQLADLRRSLLASANSKENDQHSRLQADIMQVHHDKVAYESEIEIFQLQGHIYQQMIQVQEQLIGEDRLKLERVLNQSASTLAELRASCVEWEKNIGSFRATREDTFQKYMALAKDWCLMKKRTNEYKISLEMMKIKIQFSKTSNAKVDLSSMDMSDFAGYWKLEWEQIVQKIRHDFEILYGAIHQETVCYYEKKSAELQGELEQIVDYQKVDVVKHVETVEKIQTEYQEVQKTYSHESAILLKSEALFSKLESEWKAIQIQNQEKLDVQSNDLGYLHENIMMMVSSIEEMQRSKICLESEIIIYRHILGKSDICQIAETTLAKGRKFVVQYECHGSISMECPLDGTHISLTNQSANAVIDISRWQLIRHVDSKNVLQYRLPAGLRLKPGSELRLYSKLGTEVTQVSSNGSTFSPSSFQKIVLDDVYSIGVGDRIETLLLNENGEEKASCVQSVAATGVIVNENSRTKLF
ncbi:unnamed protein product [Rotaria socialis]|uniref:LTD domain-containing protein n=1 Tax=Rotaria socialis TaxID=392032 RepID=A0A818CZP1_9BILA|nr:unnamed protein product [Rotaria socialis]CAF3445992.1 unnamed protein product [Rotaria socialis]CAF3522133.1 unnamed protein product [Rotaria socialis]CAF4340500.1 unnamed protein product [Rotaria socialis]CAF4623152.1 unnamed protein product [Rotaria socialis]